jgi:hypothetical protein
LGTAGASYPRRDPEQAAKLRVEIEAALPGTPTEPVALNWASRPNAVDALIYLGVVVAEMETIDCRARAGIGREPVKDYHSPKCEAQPSR